MTTTTMLARSSGMCRSPLSSSASSAEDAEDDNPWSFARSDDDKENVQPARDPHHGNGTGIRHRSRNPSTHKTALKRRRATQEENARPAKVARVATGKSALIAAAPPRFVEYLASQLRASTQMQHCEAHGFGLGIMLRAPSAWSDLRERRAFTDWARKLGFTRSTTHHQQVYRISTLNADVVLSGLRTRLGPGAVSELSELKTATKRVKSPTSGVSKMESAVNQAKQVKEEDEHGAQVEEAKGLDGIRSMKALIQRLDTQELEMLSVSEHDRLLSTIRHEEIANAMEDVLARPSERKTRSRAHRLSKLGRISGRRLSLIPMRSSVAITMAPTILEDLEWESEEEDSEEYHETRNEDASGISMVVRKGEEDEEHRELVLTEPEAEEQLGLRVMEIGGLVSPPTRRKTRSRHSSLVRNAVVATPLARNKKLKKKKKKPLVMAHSVVHQVFNSGFLTLPELKGLVCGVARTWRELALHAYAWRVADYTKTSQVVSMENVYQQCPRGHYLSDGAYKEVFKVFSASHKRLEAVSVMDIRSIEQLVRAKFSPHFVEIYDVFLAKERPLITRWGSAQWRKPVDLLTGSRTSIAPSKPVSTDNNDQEDNAGNQPDQLYQYIRMEFCDGGDVEDFIGLQRGKLLPVDSVVVPFFFQMVFGLYNARERLQLRHCDLKLLNFFLKDINRKGKKCADDEPLMLRYWLGNQSFNVCMPATFSYWVKLADYGTADSNANNLGKPVTLDQFTTLENTPIEFLLEGDVAEQSFAADTFSLGLCLLHLFTGSGPYEEVLQNVRCPDPLAQDVKRVWLSTKKNSGFSVVRCVAKDDPEDILVHTLYRYLVLFGLPTQNPSAHKGVDRVWNLLLKHLSDADAPDSDNDTSLARRRPSRRVAAARHHTQFKSPRECFMEHTQLYSLECGTNSIIRRGRERLEQLSGASALLRSLVAFNPAHRPTLKQTLLHEFFQSLHHNPSARSTSASRVVEQAAHYVIDCYSASPSAPGAPILAALPDI